MHGRSALPAPDVAILALVEVIAGCAVQRREHRVVSNVRAMRIMSEIRVVAAEGVNISRVPSR